MAQFLATEVRDGMRIDWDVSIAVRDGLVLKADVFRPNKPGRYPVIMTYGPYGKGLAEAAVKRMKEKKREVTLRRSLDDKTTDFAALVAQLKAQQVDTFVTTLADFQVVALADQLVAAGARR